MVTRTPSPGFTIIELMLVLTIVAVMATMALPNLTQSAKDQRVKTASFDVFSTLVTARSEAITRNASVTVTPTSGTTAWASGWEVTIGGSVLRKQDALPSLTITGPTTVVYNGNGRISGTTAPTFELSATGSSITMRCITVDLSGRPVTKAAAC